MGADIRRGCYESSGDLSVRRDAADDTVAYICYDVSMSERARRCGGALQSGQLQKRRARFRDACEQNQVRSPVLGERMLVKGGCWRANSQ